MEGTYDVLLGTQKMGNVVVSRQGLYWHFCCRCDLSGEVMYYLKVQIDRQCERLGLLIPVDGMFGLNTQLPVKRLEQGNPTFFLQARRSASCGQFIPVRMEEPFAYLTRLQEAYLATQNQQMGIILPEEK